MAEICQFSNFLDCICIFFGLYRLESMLLHLDSISVQLCGKIMYHKYYKDMLMLWHTSFVYFSLFCPSKVQVENKIDKVFSFLYESYNPQKFSLAGQKSVKVQGSFECLQYLGYINLPLRSLVLQCDWHAWAQLEFLHFLPQLPYST